MKHIMYKTQGTCSQYIDLEADDDQVITRLNVIGGCNGNLQGIAALVKGMKLEDARQRLQGITCGFKPTSCPDQISIAIGQLQQMY
ncbi:MAG: TIGR03905 family TSCPD domain-containing protein [Prevotellaceae bacterium]|jgi:uncharacterized protein (TIGR03905 family)|nr:TIGR03905 family TSCPD domain-containing protein [Prevotellaceae bacterium]MDY3855832.1 TIGR03905 family TSCPD domain-containing protein [Bacteroidaceae bacterium]